MKGEFKKFLKDFLLEIEKAEDKKREKLISLFISLLKKKPKLLSLALKAIKKRKKEREVKVILARKLNEKTIDEIKEKLKAFFGEKEFKIFFNENLIGGFLAESQDFFIDASLKGILERIKKSWMF